MTPMDAERLNKLSEAQRICLRMVFMHMSSKDIARELGISPHTVDQRLKGAMQILGVDSRVEAARILARHEAPGHTSHWYTRRRTLPTHPLRAQSPSSLITGTRTFIRAAR